MKKAQLNKVNTEIAALIEQTARLSRQPVWYPVLLSAGLVFTVATITTLLIR